MPTTNSTLVITVNTPRTVAQLGGFLKDPSLNIPECRALSHLFHRLEAGLESASFDVQTSASVAVRATNRLTLTYASITDMDTVVIAGHTLTCVTGTPDGSGDQFKKVTNLATTLANLVACINANATLKLLMSAAATATGVCTMTINAPGTIGNQATLVGSTGMVAATANFANGAGGAETAAVTYNKGR